MSHQLAGLISAIPSGLLKIDDTGQITGCSEFLENMLGYTPGELPGSDVTQLLQEQVPQSNLLETILQARSPHSLFAIRKDGSRTPVEATSQSVADGTLTAIRDVSEREAATEALRESQQINKTGTWTYDLVANEVWWSPELFRILDLPVARLAPPFETHHQLFTPDSWRQLEPAVAAAAEQGTPYELQLELARRGQRRRFAVARCEPQFDAQGKVTRLIGTFQDVTELALSQAEKERLLNRLTLAKSAAGIGIWEWNFDTDELLWDENMYEIYGVDAPVSSYGDWHRTVHPDDVDSAESDLNTMLEENTIFRSNFRIYRKSQIRHVLAIASRSQSSVIGVNMDITELVRLREETRRMNELESLGVLAGGIAHDFNNQLAGIGAEAELLSHNADDHAYVAESASRLSRAVRRATGLTKQLLTFAQGGTPVRQSSSIKRLITESVEFSLRGTPVSVAYDFQEDLHNASIDRNQIGQVFQNIVINAVQAISDQGGTLHVSARNVSGPGTSHRFVRLVFRDNGPGMPDDVQSRVFEPYYTTKPHGHGLGLSICHSIIKQHGGEIDVVSSTGEGTEISILLPATSIAVSRPAAENRELEGAGRVLIVDDMPEVLSATGRMVATLGYTPTLSSSAHEATQQFRLAQSEGRPFDVVITDLTMPGTGGGRELLQALREIDPHVKAIVASGYANDPCFARPRDFGFSGRLGKPFTLSQLGAELKSAVGSDQNHRRTA